MIPLLLLIAAPSCTALPGDAELCSLTSGTTPWIEIAIGFEAPPDPMGKRGLSAVVASALTAQLHAIEPGLGIDVDPHGLVLRTGAPASELEALLERIFGVLGARKIGGGETEAAVAAATQRRRSIADDDRGLGRLEVLRALYGEALGIELLGHPRELATISADDVASWLKQNVCSGALHLVLAGPVEGIEPQKIGALTASLQACTARSRSSSANKSASKTGLDLLVVDKPERTRATVAIGAELEGPPVERATLEAALAAFSRDLAKQIGSPILDARIVAPADRSGWILTLESAQPEKDLRAILEAKEPTLGANDRDAARHRATLRALIALRDPRASAGAILEARLEDRPATSPWELAEAIAKVSDESLSATLKVLYGKKRFVAVVTSADASRVQALGRLPGVRGASVVGYDTR